MSISVSAFAALVVFVVLAGLVQGTLGFGFTFVAAPVVNLVAPGGVPVTMLLLGVPMTSLLAWRERHAMQVSDFWWIALGRVFGTAAGVWIVRVLPSDALTVMIGLTIVVGVMLSARGLRIGDRPVSSVTAGAAAGVMGTTAALGGAALAIRFQDLSGPAYRSTLAISFAFGASLSLAGLALGEEIRTWHLELAAFLAPAMLLGIWLSRHTAARLDGPWLRPTVLTFAFVSGAASVLRPLF